MPENQEYEDLIQNVQQEIRYRALDTKLKRKYRSLVEDRVFDTTEAIIEQLKDDYPDTWNERLLSRLQEEIAAVQKLLTGGECTGESQNRAEAVLNVFKDLRNTIVYGNLKTQEWLKDLERIASTSDYQDKYEMGWAADHYKINTLLFECIDEIKTLRSILTALRSIALTAESIPSEVLIRLLENVALPPPEPDTD